MRCPKCGYISFDNLEECLKCSKDIKAVSSDLFGSTYNIQAPTFLHLHREQKEEPSEQMGLSGASFLGGDDEYVDEELNILVDEEESSVEGEIGFAEDEQVDLELSEEDEQEDDSEIEIDFSQFEDADELKGDLFEADEVEAEEAQQEQVAQPPLTIEMPGELSDISDLAPPEKDVKKDEQPAVNSAESDFADLDLDNLNFDLGLDDLDEEQPAKPETLEAAVLALDEIDFTETLAEGSSDAAKKSESTDMDLDLDLDFDLDLGSLSIQEEALK